MLNYEKRITELENEKAAALEKLKEIEGRFNEQIDLIQKNIDILEEKRKKLAELHKEEMDLLTSANELAKGDVRQAQEGNSEQKHNQAVREKVQI